MGNNGYELAASAPNNSVPQRVPHGDLSFRIPGAQLVTTEDFGISDEPTWFGSANAPLFGWLARPTSKGIIGGVVIVPSVGYEARNAKVAIRQLARSLAQAGFATLRFDLRGTGDSSEDFANILPSPDWAIDVSSAVNFIQSAGIESVSVIGFRLGATLAAAAIDQQEIKVSSLVLWDPCESGGSYLRELGALESLRRENFVESEDGSVETSEFLFSKDMVTALRSFKITMNARNASDRRTLVITRTSRPLSTRLHTQLQSCGADFRTTEEQEALLNVLPFSAAVPATTIKMIIDWLTDVGTSTLNDISFTTVTEALLCDKEGELRIRERAAFISSPALFTMLSEPIHGPMGPWVILIGNVHDDHTGQSRLWVELSRRWAQCGLRCARVDLSGLGESSRPGHDLSVEHLDPRWVSDVISLARTLDPQDPSNTVFIGFCASASLAIEGALAVKARGVCAVNPPLGRNVSHAIYSLQLTHSPLSQLMARRAKRVLLTHPWAITTIWETIRRALPGRWFADVLQSLSDQGTDLLLFGNAEDQQKHSRIPIVRSLEGRRPGQSPRFPSVLVPDLDHAMTSASGRMRVTTYLEEHVRTKFALPHGT